MRIINGSLTSAPPVKFELTDASNLLLQQLWASHLGKWFF